MKSKYLTIPLKILKSFFLAVTQVSWGVLSLFGFNLLLAYLLKENMIKISEINKLFISLGDIILQNIMIFTLIFFALYLYDEIIDLRKQKE